MEEHEYAAYMGRRWDAFNSLPPARMAAIVVGLSILGLTVLDVLGVGNFHQVPADDWDERAAQAVNAHYNSGETGDSVIVPNNEEVQTAKVRRLLGGLLGGVFVLLGLSGYGKTPR